MLVCLYARVSTTRQAENDLSIPDQLQQMRDWCQANHHQIGFEYVEPGASATDDKRPVFQQMIAETMQKTKPYDAIIIHSLSRFFRDVVEFGLYERKLKKNGIKIISITQQTSDDPMGEMSRRLFSLFDEYQSKENSNEGEQIIMPTLIAVDAGKPFVQVAAIDKSVEYLFLYPTVNDAGSDQFLIVLSYTLIEWAGVGISWAVYARLCGCFRATHDALHGGVSLLSVQIELL